MNNLLFIKLLFAHLLADFVFQNDKMVANKETQSWRGWALYAHACVVGILTYCVSQDFKITLVITISHFLIDLVKNKTKFKNFATFLLDQLAHIAIILVLCLNSNYQLQFISLSEKHWIILLGYLLCTSPVGMIIYFATKKWQEELGNESLVNAGRWIGILERVLIFTLVLIEQYEAIGFLIAAKSVLRFKDDGLKQTEYVLIGTLLSYTCAILLGLLVKIYPI